MVNDSFNFEGKNYEMIDGNIVDSRTYILVSNDLAMKICEKFGVSVKQEQTSSERFDVAYLNSKIKSRKTTASA